MKIKEIDATSVIAWSSDGIPLLATGLMAGTVDFDSSTSATLQIWNSVGLPQDGPVFSAEVEHLFHSLAWLRPLEGHTHGILVGATDDGIVHFWDVKALFDTQSLQSATIHKHPVNAAVKCMQFSPLVPTQLATGGLDGQVLVWNVQTFAAPESLGKAMSPQGDITLVAWNNSRNFVLASTSSLGYTSIWDLNKKKEVMQLLYSGPEGRAEFSALAWHPTELTKLATASLSDSCPLIMTWNMRTSQEPEIILRGHTKGVLSLDWCAQDPNLLLSAGKDNRARLWNPVLGIKLGEYPTTANWVSLARFAPRAPDVFATASYGGKVIVQTLQDTSPPVSETVQTNDDNEFWSSVSNVETQQAKFDVTQAPAWLKRPISASFGFGSKLAVARNFGGRSIVEIKKIDASQGKSLDTEELSNALQTNNCASILTTRLLNPAPDSADWDLLNRLDSGGKQNFLEQMLGLKKETESESNRIDDFVDDDEDFFSNLSNDASKQAAPPFLPTGQFSLPQSSDSEPDSELAKLLLNNKVTQAIDACLQLGKLQEALILALDQDDSVKQKVKNTYFQQAGNSVLSRLIFSASSKDITDVIKNATLSNWKDIAGSILAYYSTDSKDFNDKFVELGDRVLSDSNDKASRDNALYCYLAGLALDKVAYIWLKELSTIENELLSTPGNDVSNLFDARYMALNIFVQKVIVYRSILDVSGPVSGASIEPICKAIADFASMTTSNGDFELASRLMALLPDDFNGVKAEKERIAQALKPTVSQNKFGRGQNGYQSNGIAQQSRYAAVNPAVPASNSYSVNSQHSVPVRNVSVPATRTAGRTSVDHGSAYRQASFATSAARPAVVNPTTSYYGATPTNNYGYGAGAAQPQSYPYGQATTPANSYTPQQPIGGPIEAPVPQASSKHKTDTDGWNDLPDAFKATAKPPPRRTPAPATQQVTPPAVIEPANMPPPPPARLTTPGPPPMSANQAISRRASLTVAAAPFSTTTRPEPANSKYAPSVTSPPPMPLAGPRPGAFDAPAIPQPPKVTAPPKNPYAPSPQAATPPSIPSQPVNVGAPPRPGQAAVSQPNPYATNAPAQRLVAPAANPYAMPNNNGPTPMAMTAPQPPSFPPQPNSISRNSSQSNFAPPKAPVNPYGGVSNTPPNQMAAPPIPGPPRGPQSRNPSNAFLPPSNPAASPSVPSSPGKPPSRYAPTQGQQQAPPQPSGPPPPRAPSQMQGPPAVATPRMGPASMPPRSRAASTHSVMSQATAPPNGPPSPLQQLFTPLVDEIKKIAPEKYSKHVLDMEKRFNLLYAQLQRPNFNEETKDNLNRIAEAVRAKDYPTCHSTLDKVLAAHAKETWTVGVKRLVNMREALKDQLA